MTVNFLAFVVRFTCENKATTNEAMSLVTTDCRSDFAVMNLDGILFGQQVCHSAALPSWTIFCNCGGLLLCGISLLSFRFRYSAIKTMNQNFNRAIIGNGQQLCTGLHTKNLGHTSSGASRLLCISGRVLNVGMVMFRRGVTCRSDMIACSIKSGSTSFITNYYEVILTHGWWPKELLKNDMGPSLPVTRRRTGPYEDGALLLSLGLG